VLQQDLGEGQGLDEGQEGRVWFIGWEGKGRLMKDRARDLAGWSRQRRVAVERVGLLRS
jgi:hypothetical protein